MNYLKEDHRSLPAMIFLQIILRSAVHIYDFHIFIISVCNDFNTTGDLESCDIKCCTGDLCNAPLVVTSSVPAPASSVSATTTASAVTSAGPGTSSPNTPTEKSEPTRIPAPTSAVSVLSSSFGFILLAFILCVTAWFSFNCRSLVDFRQFYYTSVLNKYW